MIWRRGASVSLLLLFLCGCASVRRVVEPFVLVQRDAGWWYVSWVFDRATTELRFEREAAGFRARRFEVVTPGWSFAREGEYEVLRGGPSGSVMVRFQEFSEHLPKDYEFFQRFSDGSVAIYTGHLLGHANGAMIRKFTFLQPRILIGGKLHEGRAQWRDEPGLGTYVYMGGLAPVQSEQTLSIVDPGLPDWLEAQTRDALPRLFALYTRRLGAKLDDRPSVLFSWKESEQSGYSRSGGTLPGIIQLGIEGVGWQTASNDGTREIFHFLAHEAAHLWNGQIVRYPEEQDAWIHEGSADALAERALLDMGLIDESRFLAYQTAALNQCRRGLGAHPLRDAAKRQRFELYYSCGNTIALLTEKSAGGDLFAFWQALIARALQQPDRQYQPEDYFAVMRERGAAERDVDVVRALVEQPSDADVLVNALRERGVQLATADEPPEDYGQSLSREAFLQLLSARCKGSYGFNVTPRGFVLNTPLNCEGLNAGEAVTAIGGHDVLRAGHRAWDELHARCAASEAIEVTSGGRSVMLPCAKPVAKRLPYITITAR